MMGVYGQYPSGIIGVTQIQSVTFEAAPATVAYVVDAMEALFPFRVERATLISRECFTGDGVGYVEVFNETTGNPAALCFFGPVTGGAMTGADIFPSRTVEIDPSVSEGDKLLIRYTTSTDAYALGAVVRMWISPTIVVEES